MIVNRLIMSLMLVMFVVACTSTQEKRYQENQIKAAEYNTQLGVNYLHRGNLDLAKTKFEKALDQNKNNANANSGYALLLARLGDHKAAEKYFRRAQSLDPTNPEVLNNFGTYLCEKNKFKEADIKFLEAVANPLYKTPEFAYSNAGTCALKAGNNSQAEAQFQSALQANPRFSPALLNMAELKFKEKHYRQAESYLGRYHEQTQATPKSLLLGVYIYTALGDHEAAGSFGLKLKRLYPNSPQVLELNS